MSNDHGCKEDVITLISHYLIDITKNYRKITIIPNVTKPMFQFIFISFDWILIEQIIASSTPSLLRETDFKKLLPGVLSGGVGHEQKCIDSMHFLGMWTP